MHEGQPGNLKPVQIVPLISYKSSFCGLVITALISISLASAENLQDGINAYVRGDYSTAYQVLSLQAVSENPEVQNLVGLMLYLGQGTAADAPAAHRLFHSAAQLGVADARRNLGILHSLGAPGVAVDYDEARSWFTMTFTGSDRNALNAADGQITIPETVKTVIEPEFRYEENGKFTYLTFCSGCHGFSGMRFFPNAPSFAMGERITKSSVELMQAILLGKGLMPSWEDKLPVSDLEDALGYLRELALRTGYGTDTSSYDKTPGFYYVFPPAGVFDPYVPDWSTDADDGH